MKPKKQSKIQKALSGISLVRERFLFQSLGDSLADRLYHYFHGTVDFDYAEEGEGAFVECSLPYLFASLCLAVQSARTDLVHIRMYARGDTAEIVIKTKDGVTLPRQQMYEYASLGGMMLEPKEDGVALHLPLKREATLHLFTNREGILSQLDRLFQLFDIL